MEGRLGLVEGVGPALASLFSPRAVAVIGASSNPDAIGGRPIHYARAMGFEGALYPINPNRAEIQGLRAYPDLASAPGPVDLAVVAVGAPDVARAVAEAAAKGATAAVILSAGFAEAGSAGIALQAELKAVGQAHGVRVLGPNCLGLYSAEAGLAATFASCFQEGAFPRGRVALVSQSGAYGSYLMLLAARMGVGVGRWVTTGNEMDLTVADLIAHFAADPAVGVIGCVAEGVSDGRAFLAALETARAAGKPVVLMKMGRTAGGAQAAQSHTASLAVDDAVFEAVVRQAGAWRVRTTREMLDLLYALELRPPPRGNRLGVVTMSGGVGVLMSDAAADCGLVTPPLPAEVSQRLQAANPLGASVNPVDVTGQAMKQPALLGQALRALLGEGGMDAVAVFLMNWLEGGERATALGVEIDAALDAQVPAAEGGPVVAIVGSMTAQAARGYRARGVLVFDDPDRAIATLGAMAAIGRRLGKPVRATPDVAHMPLADGSELQEVRAKALLVRIGLATPAEAVCATPAEAGRAAKRMGGAVVLKIISPDLPHKSDIGGVRLGLKGAEETQRAAETMLAEVGRHRPDARLEGFLVSAMITDGIEMIVSTHVDPVFGPLVMAGLGGTLVEVMGDVAFRYGAVDAATAREMIAELTGARLLAGVRGAPPCDVAALADAVSALSRFGVANAGLVASVEVNPLVVRPEGLGCVMLDALITPIREG